MSAAWMDLDEQAEATEVEVRAKPRRVRGRLVSVSRRPELEETPDSTQGDPAISPQQVLQPPPRSGTLSELYLRSVEGRRSLPKESPSRGFEPGRPRVVFARSDDPSLQLRRTPHGFELSGQPSAEPSRHERRLSVAFDGQLFAVVIQPSDSTPEILDRLGARLGGAYETRVVEFAPGRWAVGFFEPLLASA